jgi:hypothetical protein
MALLLDWIAETRAAAPPVGAGSALAGGAPPAPESGRQDSVESPQPRGAVPAARPAPRTGVFRRDGDLWTLVLDEHTTRLRHMVGLTHLALLLRTPEREFPATDLAGPGPEAPLASGDAGELLDAQARAEYTARLRAAREDLAEAERLNDRGRADRLSEEIEMLAAELARGFGLGGRARRAGQRAERARLAVSRAIRYALDRIAEHDAGLAEHLGSSVRTGRFCSYVPPARDRVAWEV